MSKLNVEIVSPSEKVYTGESYMVTVPGASGSMGFLPGHVALVTGLGEGTVSLSDTVNANDAKKTFKIKGGYVQIFNDNVVVLAEHVE